MNITNQIETSAREWTWMVYMAGDNNLEDNCIKDLLEMKRVGSTLQVDLIAQVDRMSDKGTRRYHLCSNSKLENDIVELLPETNSGDPATLMDFIIWAEKQFPARHYALILWNHGSGWKEDDIYQVTQRLGMEKTVLRGTMRGIAGGKASRALFRTTIDKIVPQASIRGIAYDDSDADFLDNAEMKKVLHEAASRTGQKIDLLGFDACLMNMLEVVYQVRNECHVVVGSEETEPGDGWPYDSILSRLIGKPSMPPDEVGKVIVNAYINYYEQYYPTLPLTQSAIQTDHLDPLIESIDILSKALMARLDDPTTLGKIYRALRYSQNFKDPDYLDLGHYCQLLSEGDPDGEMGDAAKGILRIINGADSPILATQCFGTTIQHATGLSIYLPGRVYSGFYSDLDFAQETLWDDFLRRFMNPNG
jgi:hypothetical protein